MAIVQSIEHFWLMEIDQNSTDAKFIDHSL